jgi:hypothetical protein
MYMLNLSEQENINMKCQASIDNLTCLPELVLLATLVVLLYTVQTPV